MKKAKCKSCLTSAKSPIKHSGDQEFPFSHHRHECPIDVDSLGIYSNSFFCNEMCVQHVALIDFMNKNLV